MNKAPEFHTLFLDMSCIWVAQRGYWGTAPNEYGYFKTYEEAIPVVNAMNKLVPTELEKSRCRWVTESRPKCAHTSCSTVAGNRLMCNTCGHTWCPVDV